MSHQTSAIQVCAHAHLAPEAVQQINDTITWLCYIGTKLSLPNQTHQTLTNNAITVIPFELLACCDWVWGTKPELFSYKAYTVISQCIGRTGRRDTWTHKDLTSGEKQNTASSHLSYSRYTGGKRRVVFTGQQSARQRPTKPDGVSSAWRANLCLSMSNTFISCPVTFSQEGRVVGWKKLMLPEARFVSSNEQSGTSVSK